MISIGTDCSGIEAPIEALKRLKVKYEHKWSCEIDKYAKKSILANHTPGIFFDDITKNRNLPKIDLYIAGFPCQTFSSAGKREGMKDKERGCIFNYCVKAIQKSKPVVFILENVKGLLTIENGKVFENIIKTLKKLKIYEIHYKVLNSKDYGTPQNRERIFIIGLKIENIIKPFEWPKIQKLKFSANDILSKSDLPKVENLSERQQFILNNCQGNFCDFNFLNNRYPTLIDVVPTITTHPRIFSKKYNRFLTTDELLTLQGFSSFKRVVSDSHIRHQIGNSMTVTTLMALYRNIFKSIRFD